MYNNIKLEKGLYSITGKTFTQALAELDPDANYENTELKGLDAFERQLKRFDIKVKGANSDRVEKSPRQLDPRVFIVFRFYLLHILERYTVRYIPVLPVQ